MYKFLSVIFAIGFVGTNADLYPIPDDFLFGVATSAYQVEGGWAEDGKGQNIWDNITNGVDYTADGLTGNKACDSYHKWEEDIALLKYLGVNFYRFSLSWSRILPTGFTNQINPAGIEYYNKLIDKLLENDIEPLVTIFHFDLPQPLQDLGGLANERIALYLEDYARIVFYYFGDRVKRWITINEPYTYCSLAYQGLLAPLINSDGIGTYLCGRTMLLGHALVYRMYENEFKSIQGGTIGITINSHWYEPASKSPEDLEAQNRAIEMVLGWWMNPIFGEGDYPQLMKDRITYYSLYQNFSESRLPPFSKSEIALIRGSFDFLGLNYYTGRQVESDKLPPYNPQSMWQDVGMIKTQIPGTEPSGAVWLHVYPPGIRSLLNYIRVKYNNPPVLITENGFPDNDGELCDPRRINFIQKHLMEVFKAKEEGCNVFGYTYWSFIDDFEWNSGYTLKFGLIQVDFNSPNRTRTVKSSGEFFRSVLNSRILPTGKIV